MLKEVLRGEGDERVQLQRLLLTRNDDDAFLATENSIEVGDDNFVLEQKKAASGHDRYSSQSIHTRGRTW